MARSICTIFGTLQCHFTLNKQNGFQFILPKLYANKIDDQNEHYFILFNVFNQMKNKLMIVKTSTAINKLTDRCTSRY